MRKVSGALDSLEKDWFDQLSGEVSVGSIAAGCALAYLDFRFTDVDWREGRPHLTGWEAEFSKRPSMVESRPTS